MNDDEMSAIIILRENNNNTTQHQKELGGHSPRGLSSHTGRDVCVLPDKKRVVDMNI